MPATTRKRTAPPSSDDVSCQSPTATSKRRRTSQTEPQQRRPSPPSSRRKSRSQVVIDDSDSLFGDDPKDDAKDDESKSHTDVIDLATTDEVPKANFSSNEDRRVSFHKFSCAICMDDVSNLTITHCGHSFCGDCLSSALHVEATRNKCPICRQKIEQKERSAYNQRTKGLWPLCFKLKSSSNKKGKQPMR